MEEISLVEKAARHDKEAFSQLMHLHGQSMYKVAKAILKNDEDATDAMQETALTCWEKIATLREKRYFKTWLIRILINHCNAIYRQKSRYIPQEVLPETVKETDEYAEVEWLEMIKCLEEKYRIVLVLYYAEGFQVKDIAKMLHITQSAVKQRLLTARKKMGVQFGYLQEKSSADYLQFKQS